MAVVPIVLGEQLLLRAGALVVSIAAFHAGVRGSFPGQGLGGLEDYKKMFLPHPLLKLSIVGSLRDREVACSASHLQGFNFESCVLRAMSSHSSHHPQELLLAQFSLYVNKRALARFISFHFISFHLAAIKYNPQTDISLSTITFLRHAFLAPWT